jgi:hypothetical protein
VAALHHDAHPFGLGLVQHGLGHLLGQPLLDLQAAREAVHDARDLADAEHLVFGDVAHVAAPVERQQMVLAEAVDLDVAHDDHVVEVRLEHRAVEHLPRRLPVAAGQKRQGLGHPFRRDLQPFALGVLAEFDQQLPHQPRDALFIDLFLHGLHCTPAPAFNSSAECV